MRTLRVVVFPREQVPLAVHSEAAGGLEGASPNHDLWRESDRYMRSEEFTRILGHHRKWAHHEDTWELEVCDA